MNAILSYMDGAGYIAPLDNGAMGIIHCHNESYPSSGFPPVQGMSVFKNTGLGYSANPILSNVGHKGSLINQ